MEARSSTILKVETKSFKWKKKTMSDVGAFIIYKANPTKLSDRIKIVENQRIQSISFLRNNFTMLLQTPPFQKFRSKDLE